MLRVVFLLCLLSGLARAQDPDPPGAAPADSLAPTLSEDSDDPDSGALATSALPLDSLPVGQLGYALTLEGDFRQGNLQRTLYLARLILEYLPKHSWLGFYASPRYSRGTNGGVLQEAELFLDLNATLFYSRSDVYGLAFGVFEQSNLRHIDHRRYGGAGLGWRITGGRVRPGARLKIALTNALLFENTDFAEVPGQPTRDVRVLRNSSRLRVTANWLEKRLSLAGTLFVQPALNQANLRANALVQVLMQLSKRLAFSVSLENSYESVVAPGRQTHDTHLTFGLTYQNTSR